MCRVQESMCRSNYDACLFRVVLKMGDLEVRKCPGFQLPPYYTVQHVMSRAIICDCYHSTGPQTTLQTANSAELLWFLQSMNTVLFFLTTACGELDQGTCCLVCLGCLGVEIN